MQILFYYLYFSIPSRCKNKTAQMFDDIDVNLILINIVSLQITYYGIL